MRSSSAEVSVEREFVGFRPQELPYRYMLRVYLGYKPCPGGIPHEPTDY